MIQTYRCTRLGPVPTRMFTAGKSYRHVDGYNQPAVVDDLGHVRVIGNSLSFITHNSCTSIPPGGFISRALFEEGPLLMTSWDWLHISRCAQARGYIACIDGDKNDRVQRELQAAAYTWAACYCSPPLGITATGWPWPDP